MVAAADPVPNNLPLQLTSFIGRRAELTAVADLLTKTRLVTLTGPGGAGKTRLAIQAAAQSLDRFPDGAWWVELAALTDGEAVADAATAAVGANLAGKARAPRRSLVAHLATRRTLLCLDNAEHVLDDVADLVEEVLRSASDVTVVVTSREPLGVPGEVVWRVPPLEDDDAVQLFVERAALVQPSFQLDGSKEAAVRSIALHLDGIPLALELAAAWLGTLTPQEVLAGLDDRFRLLVRGPRGAQRRQHTLAGSIGWSHALLDGTDRRVFRRLSVFAGSFGMDAARAAGAVEPAEVADVLPSLGRLVDKSLIVVEEHAGTARYRLLETIRAYAAARLVESGEQQQVRDAHLAWCVAFAERADDDRERDPDRWRQALRLEYDNLRAAVDWGLKADDPASGRRLAASLAWLWHHDRRGREGLAYLRRAADRLPDDRSQLQARLLTGIAIVADTAEPLDLEYDAASRALEIATEVGDQSLRALCLSLKSVGAFYTDFDEAWELCEQAAAAADATGGAFALAGARALQAIILHLRDRHADADALFMAVIPELLTRHQGVAATALGYQATSALYTGDLERARRLATEAVRVAEPLGDYLRVGMARSALALVHALAGEHDEAERVILPTLQDVEDADGAAVVTGLPWVVGTLAMRRGDPSTAASWFEREAGATDRGTQTWVAAQAQAGLGRALVTLGRTDEAEVALECAAAIASRLGMPRVIADVLATRAELVATHADGLDRAVDLHHDALTQRVDHGLRAFQPDSLDALVGLGSRIKPRLEDVRILAASSAARDALGLPCSPTDERRSAATMARLTEGLGVASVAAATADGRQLSLDDAVAYARRTRGTRGRPATGWASLTPTELEVAGLVAQGLNNPDIGARLYMSRGTVKTHLSHIFTKLDLSNRTELATLASSRLGGGAARSL